MEQYRREIKSKGDFNRVRKVLSDSGLVTLVPYSAKGSSYILIGKEPIKPTQNADEYLVEISRRQMGMFSSNSVRMPMPPRNDFFAKLYNDITKTLS